MVKLVHHRRIRTNLIYSVAEAARLLEINPKTLDTWIARGLPVLSRHPRLIRGADIKRYLDERKRAKVRHCTDDELFCFSCQSPRVAVQASIETVRVLTTGAAHLRGLCSHCGTTMSQLCRRSKVEHLASCSGTPQMSTSDFKIIAFQE